MSCVRVNRFRASLQSFGAIDSGVMDVIAVFQQNWGAKFVNNWSANTLGEQWNVHKSRKIVSGICKIRTEESRIHIELRPCAEVLLGDQHETLAGNEFLLSVMDVANRLRQDAAFLPDELVLICGGNRKHEWSAFLCGRQYELFPRITLTSLNGARRLVLDAVWATNFPECAVVPVGILE